MKDNDKRKPFTFKDRSDEEVTEETLKEAIEQLSSLSSASNDVLIELINSMNYDLQTMGKSLKEIQEMAIEQGIDISNEKIIERKFYEPETLTLLNAKVPYLIFNPNQPIQPNKRTPIGVIGDNVITYVTLNSSSALDKDEAILTPFDGAVYNAVLTIDKDPRNKGIFTLKDLNQVLNNLGKGYINLSEKTKNELEKSLFKLRTTNTKLEYKDEAEAYKKNDKYGFGYEGMLLPLDVIPITEGNQEGKGYIILKNKELQNTPLHRYNLISKQFLNVNTLQYNTTKQHELNNGILTEKRRNTKQYTLIKNHLLRQINYMKSNDKRKQKRNSSLRLETIQKDIYGTERLTAKQKRTFREDVELYLLHLKAINDIEDYKEEKQGKKIIGFKVFL